MTTNSSDSPPVKQQSDESKIEIVVPAPECCIYNVPKRLRAQNDKAYTPQIVSIGPFHYPIDDPNKTLADMENQKIHNPNKTLMIDMEKQKERYYNAFVKRIYESDPEKLQNFVKEKEQCIRRCYAAEFPDFPSERFRRMILYDAIFITELFLRNFDNWRYAGDFLLDQLWLKEAIKLELQLLENQIPFFVLDEIYKIAFGRPTGEVSLLSLCCKFFGYDKPNDMFRRIPDGIQFKHFVDLARNCIVEFLPSGEELSDGDLPSAVKLDESGVKFKRMDISDKVDGARGLLDIRFQPRKRSKCMQLLKGNAKDELQIPRIIIQDTTECLIRNMMALEQCHYPSKTHLCNYIELIDSLINTKEDVDLLVEKEIISNHVGHHKAISRMFNGLCLEIRLSEKSCYQGIRKELKHYHDKWWNRTKATLISVYFKDVWRGTATVAATIVLLLQLIQTAQRLSGGWTPH